MSLPPDQRVVPWQDPAWMAEMASWVDARLAAAGIRRRSEVARIWLRPRAALLSVETDRGRMWAKAVPPVFAHEVALTELLADIDPGIVPPVVAADRALGRIITEHVEGPLLSGIDDPAIWIGDAVAAGGDPAGARQRADRAHRGRRGDRAALASGRGRPEAPR